MLAKHDWSGLRKLIAAKALVGELPDINEYTATGNPAEFATNLIRPLQSFEIPLTPVQSGSGTPSPDNVRPISGWSGVTVTANGQTVLVAWEPVAGVVYGGTLDLVTGMMTVTQKLYTLSGADSEGWAYLGTSLGRYRFYSKEGSNGATPGIDYGSGKTSVVAADYLGTAPNGTSASYTEYDGSIITGGTGADNVVVGVTFASTAAELKAYFAEHPLHIICILKTPQTFQLSPVEIKTIIGQNNIGTNTNGTNTIKYLKRG